MEYNHFTATDEISGLSSIIAKIGQWVKNSSDEQHLSMTTYFHYTYSMANDGICGLSSVIAEIVTWVKNSSDEQYLSMSSCIIAILRQMITSWLEAFYDKRWN